MGDQERDIQVSLREMARRRDAWRQRAEQSERQVARLKAVAERWKCEAESASRSAERARYDVVNADLRSDYAWTEARRHAEECGRLRDEVARLTGGKSEDG